MTWVDWIGVAFLSLVMNLAAIGLVVGLVWAKRNEIQRQAVRAMMTPPKGVKRAATP